jgi:hypothetical protein
MKGNYRENEVGVPAVSTLLLVAFTELRQKIELTRKKVSTQVDRAKLANRRCIAGDGR